MEDVLVRTARPLPAVQRRERQAGKTPLSVEQQVYWHFESKDIVMRNEHLAMRWPFDVDRARLERVLATILQEHELLRAAFRVDRGSIVRWSVSAEEFRVKEFDLSAYSVSESEARATEIAVDLVNERFVLGRETVFRASIFRMAGGVSLILLVLPHIVCDAWSLRIIQNAINTHYYDLVDGREISPSRDRLQYADYVAWQQSVAQLILDDHRPYWARVLDGAEAVRFPPAQASPECSPASVETLDAFIPSALLTVVTSMARASDSTLFVAVVTAFRIVLGRLCRSRDLTIGTITNGRRSRDLLDIVGPFANYVPVRVRLEMDVPFRDALSAVDAAVRGAMAHQVISVPHLAMSLNVDPAICNVVVNFVNTSMFSTRPPVEWKVPGADVFDYHFHLPLKEIDMYMDLQLLVLGTKEGCLARFLYRPGLLSRDVIQQMSDDMLRLLQVDE